MLKSKTAKLYLSKLGAYSIHKINFVDSVYELCERNYENGGDIVIETMEPKDVLSMFKTLDDVKKYIGLQVENATNFREGTDSDQELERLRKFENEWKD